MKTTATVVATLVILTATTTANAFRFGGQGLGSTQNAGLSITSSSTTLTFPIANPEWSYDINTDGLTLDVNEVTVEWSATGLVLSPFDSIDITLSAFVPPQTGSITPTGTSIWKLDNFSMSSLSVSGTFYGFGGTVVPIAGSLSRIGDADFANYIQLDMYPDFVGMYNGPKKERETIMSWQGFINIGPSFFLETVNLRTPVDQPLARISEPGDFNNDGIVDGEDFILWQLDPGVGSLADWEANYVTPILQLPGDFNGDLIVDGADFLEWQREDGSPASLLEWEANYGNDYALAAASATVPEPSTLLLASLTGVLIGSRRRRV
jgi:hypothetical protein